MSSPETVTLSTARDTLGFEAGTGRLVSFRSRAAPGQEFLAPAPDHPTFVIGYLDDARQYRLLPSTAAERVQVEQSGPELQVSCLRLGGRDLDVTWSVRAAPEDDFSRWRISLRNGAGLPVVDVQFPFIVCTYDLGGRPGSEAVLLPWVTGRLIEAPGSGVPGATGKLQPDSWRAWEFTSINGDFDFYPGGQFAQFVAYYNDRAGLYLACHDTEGNIKRFRALHRHPGMRLGVAHVGDWPARGERAIEYETVLGSFSGDWYEAASLYRDWTLAQKWATPLQRRTDVPQWLLDSPAYITIRPQGIVDDGPVIPVEEFLPYEEKCIPLLQKVSERVDAPVVAVMMGWERAASWVYPDCFPPVGGDDSMARFTRAARRRGWHVGAFCNGSRWVTGHLWNGYDGRDYFRQHDGAQGACREADGSLWRENWDQSWRPSYACCLGAEQTRQTAADFVKRLIGWGYESVQFFDQNCGATTFACFAGDHGHPSMPGKWMSGAMARTIDEFRAAAQQAGEPGVINSAEAGVNELNLPLFQETDMRVFPPGYGNDFVPLYQFLFHECIVIQGMMGQSPEPYHLPIRNAANCVYGEIPGGVLTGDGSLLNKDTGNWAPWAPKVGSDDDAFAMIRAVTALRRGPGRDFLVYGRMLRPCHVLDIPTIEWTDKGREWRIPAVFHSAWQAPDGRVGVVLANWTAAARTVTVQDGRLTDRGATEFRVYSIGQQSTVATAPVAPALSLTVPPCGCVLLEA